MNWIDVNKKLPEIIDGTDYSDYCLVVDGYNFYIARRYSECYTSAENYHKGITSTGWIDEDFDWLPNVTYWYYLPIMPQKGNQNG